LARSNSQAISLIEELIGENNCLKDKKKQLAKPQTEAILYSRENTIDGQHPPNFGRIGQFKGSVRKKIVGMISEDTRERDFKFKFPNSKE
jgi:hypothetical protein